MDYRVKLSFGSMCLMAGMLVGCSESVRSDKAFVIKDIVWEMEPRVSVTVTDTNKVLVLERLSSDDVIVSVNGYPLRKATYDDIMVLKARGLAAQKNSNQLIMDKQLEEYRSKLIRNFICQRLMLDNAFSEGVVTTNEVLSHVGEKLSRAAKQRKTTVEQWLKNFPGDKKYLFYELATSYVMGKLIEKRIPPIAEVTETLREGVKKTIHDSNVASRATNEMVRARLADWKRQLLEKKLDFSQVAKAFSQDLRDDSKAADGYWGEFEESEMDDPRVAAAVFALPSGAISDPLEDEEGFHLVKILEVVPGKRDETGRLIERERRKLAHIYIEKQPLLVEDSDEVLTEELKGQFQTRAINGYVANLQTNGLNQVVYPHGKPLYH